MLDFGCVEEGGEGEQTVQLENSSPAEATYQWDLDCSGHSVFSIHPASGTVRPHSRTTLKAVYRPAQPFAHHRRVALLILHRVGSCGRNAHKDAPLRPFTLLTYLNSPVGPHVPRLNWDLSLKAPATVRTET